MKEMWDKRYSVDEYIYGEEPNNFFKEFTNTISPSKLLLPAEGEGRNAVYAAELGWKVDAFDQSIEARSKALSLAQRRNTTISYDTLGIEDILTFYQPSSYDLIALIYLHLPTVMKSTYLPQLVSLLKPGGFLILEGFSTNHIKYQSENGKVGGPQDIEMLYSTNEIATLFKELCIKILTEEEIELNEGVGHIGKGSVVRFVGQKL